MKFLFFITVKLKGDLNEEAFVEKLVKRLQGGGGITVPAELQTEAEAEAYKSSSIMSKVKRLLLKCLIQLTKL